MRRLGVLMASVLALAGCGTDSGANEFTVVASTTILGDIVENIVGNEAAVEVLLEVGGDPHDFQPSSAQVASMQSADLVVVNGLGLEQELVDVVESLVDDGANVVQVGPALDPIAFDGGECDPADTDHEEEADHDHEGGCDPHVWMDPLRMVEAVRLIESALVSVQPDVDWSSSADTYVQQLEDLHGQVETLLSSVPSSDRKLITNHEALGYLAARYGYEVIGVVVPGGSTLSDPSSAELAALVEVMTSEGSSVIFTDNSAPDDLAAAVAAEVGEEVEVVNLFTGSLGQPGSEEGTYLGMMRTNAMLISEALG